MNGELLILFIILLLGLILCSFLGGKGCIRNVQESFSNTTTTNTYNGENGASATIKTDSNGNKLIVFTDSNGNTTSYTYSSQSKTSEQGNVSLYTGPNGAKALVTDNNNGTSNIAIIGPNNENIVTLTTSNTNLNTNNSYNNNYDNYNHYTGASYPIIYYGPDGGTARVIKTANNNTIVITYKDGTTKIYYIDKNNTNADVDIYYGENGGSAKIITDINGKKAVEITGPDGSKVIYNSETNNLTTYNSETGNVNHYDNVDYDNYNHYNPYYRRERRYRRYKRRDTYDDNHYTYNDRYDNYNDYNDNYIPRNRIPEGDEDLYILKSQVVPPVCPRCPDPIIKEENDNASCPPCPACARCPEPSFDCKKVPNYNVLNDNYMPVPVLSSFSSFGM